MADFDSDIAAFDEAAGGADTHSAAAADNAAAATTAAAESNTAEATKASDTNAQTSGTAAGASSSASPPSATNSGSTAVIASVPAVADLAALESEAEQLSQLEVETLLSFLADYYTIDLVRLGGKDQAAKDPAVQQQQQIVTDILRVEGCAQCLVAHTYDQDECAKAEDANKSPEAAATSRAANDAFILLGCKLLHCKHVVHVLCVLKLQAKLRAAAAAGSAVVNKMILPTLDLCHSTSFFRVIAFPIGTQGSLLPSLPSAHTSPQHPSHSYYLELASTHHMSNAQNLHLSWTHAPVHSFVDVKSGGEFIMLLANHPEANHSGYGDLVRPQDLSVSAAGAPHANNASAPDFASFFLTRGKFHFTCIQQTDKGANGGNNGGSGGVPQITNHWSHTLNYDLSTTSASTPHMKLVLVDAHTKNILTIGVQKIHTGAASGANAPAGQPSLAIAYIKYEFAPAMQTPPLSPPLSLNTHTAPTTSVVSVLAGSMGGNGGAATFGGHGLDAFTGSTGALANSAAFGLPGASSGVVSNALSQRGFDPTAESIVRDPRDPPTMRIGTGPLATPDPLAGIAGIDPRDPPRGNQGAQQGAQAGGMGFNQFDRQEGRGGRDRDGGRGGRFGNQQQQNAGSGASGSDFYNATNETGEWDLAMLDAALDRQLAERRNKPDPFGERSGAGGAGAGGANWDRRRGSDDRGGSSSGGGGGVVGNDNDALFLPALPSFPTHLMNQPGMVNQPVLNLTLDQVRGNVVRLSKSHSGSRFVQSKLEARDAAFFSLFYDEMREHVPDLMIDNFGHFAIEKLIALCNDEQALTLLQRLAPNINIVACQKHGSFSVQALVDTLHTPAQIYTLVEAMKPDILRIITHASGHFVVLRMLQRFPYQSTKFIDECIWANTATIATDHHGLRVVKAVLAVRRSTELTRLFKQVARLTMKLVEHQYGNYCQEEHTLLALARGGSVMAKDVQVGDQLAGQDGAVVTIQKKTSFDVDELYRVQTANGQYDVTADHLVTVRWAKSPYVTIFRAGAKGGQQGANAGDVLTMRAHWYASGTGLQQRKMWRVLLTTPTTPDADHADSDGEEAEEDEGERPVVVDAQGTREELEAIAWAHINGLPAESKMEQGTLFEVPAKELYDTYWKRWHLGQSDLQAYATGALTLLRAPVGLSAEQASPEPAPHEAEHLEQFAQAVRSAKQVASPGQKVLERFVFRDMGDGTYKPLEVGQPGAGMVYQLHNPLVGEEGTQSLNAAGDTAYTFLHMHTPHQQLGVDVARSHLVITELNPIASDTGMMQSVAQLYDAVCADSITAVLQLNCATVVSFGSQTNARWREAVAGNKCGLSGGRESRVYVQAKEGTYDVPVLEARHAASGQAERAVRIYLAPHPSNSREQVRLAAVLATAHGVPGELIPERLAQCSALTHRDVLQSMSKLAGRATVVGLEVDGNHRYAFASGQLTHNCVQGVLDVAPPGVRTNIKVKMEGKYMRLSKQKFSSNVVERCLKQSSSHWRTIIIRELIAQPAVSELLRDRYGNYVLQTALAVANAQQVQEILRSITPYLPSLRDNVRQKWKKMLRKAGSLAAAGQAGTGFTGLGGDSPQPTSPASPSSPASRSDSPFQEPPSLQLGAQQQGSGGAGGPNNGPNAQSSAQAQGQRVLASVFINPNRAHHGHHAHGQQHHHAHNMHNMHPSQMAAQQQQQQQLPFHAQHQGHQQFNPQLHHAANSFSPSGGAGVGVGGAGDNYADRSGNFNSNWGAAGGAGGSSHNFGAASGGYGGGSSAPFNPNSLGSYNSSSYAGSNPAGAGVGGLGFAGANGAGFSLGSGNLSSSLAAQLNNPYGVGVAGLNALGGGVGGGVGGANSANALAGLNYFGSGGYGVGVGVGGVNNAFGALNVGGGIGAAQTAQTPNAAGTINAGLYDPNNNNLRMF